MNYINFFAKGGKTKGSDIIKGIQNILGVDDEQMAQLWQIGLNKYGSEEGIAEAINQATKGITDTSSPDEVKTAIASVFSTGSEMFKCGGKMQRLAVKFGKGGSVDCGCNGVKVGADGMEVPPRPKMKKVPSVGRATNRRVGLAFDSNGMPHVFEDAVVGGNSTETVASVRQPGDTVVTQRVATMDGWAPSTYKRGSDGYNSIMSRLRGYFPKFDDGGSTISLQSGGETPAYDVQLTRRQAKKISKENKDYTGRDFRTGMRNAKRYLKSNTDLNRRDRRNAAKVLAAGLTTHTNQIDTSTDAPQVVIATYRPQRYTEGVIETGPVSVVSSSAKKQPVAKPIVQEGIVGSAPSITDSLAAQKAKTDAWYQYQYERELYDQANGNYRPNQDSAAYQHWMWKDFNDAWDDRTGTVKRDFLMRSPSQDELLAFQNAGEFTHGSLPWTRADREAYGVDYNKRQFYFDNDSKYRADMQAHGIPATSDLYNGLARTMGTVIGTGVGAGISGVGEIPINADDYMRWEQWFLGRKGTPHSTFRNLLTGRFSR